MNVKSRSSPGIEAALLGLLSERPMHGYEICQQLSAPAGLGLIWRVKQAHLYALLEQLEADGYVASTLELQPKAPPRKVLILTSEGRRVFDAWLQKPVASAREMRIEFLAKLYLAWRAGRQVALCLLTAQHGVCQVWSDRLEAAAASAAGDASFDVLTWQFRASQVEAILRWLEACADAVGGDG